MAVIKYDPAADKIQGSRSGTVFSQSRSGFHVRTRRSPTQARTNRRTSIQTALSQCAGRWFSVVSGSQRDDWNDLGNDTTWTNPFGVEYHPTGFNLYCRSNILRLLYGLAFEDESPTDAVCPAFQKCYFWNEETLQLYVSGASSTPNNYQTFFDISPVLPVDLHFYSGPFLWNANASGSSLKSDHALGSPGQYAAGNLIAIRWRDMAVNASLSDPQVDLFRVEGPKMFTLQAQLNSGTFSDGVEIHWLYLGSVLMFYSPNSGRGLEVIPLACRLRHVSLHVNLKTRVGNPPLVYCYLCKNATYFDNFAIPGSQVSNVQINHTDNLIASRPYANDDTYSCFLFCNCGPGQSLPFSQAVVTAYFEIGDFT